MSNTNTNDNRKLEALIKVCTAVNRHINLDEVLHAIMLVATDIMQVETSSLAIEDEQTGDLIFHTAFGEGAGRIEHIRMKRGEGIVGWVAENGKSAIVNDAINDERFCTKVDDESGFVTRSILCAPLKTPNRTLGALEVINTLDNRDFTDADRELCEAIAGQAAIAIENSLLHESIVKNERMAAIGQTIASLGHCIKNVLHGIEGGAYMIDTGISKDDSVRLTRGWQIVRKNNAFMQDLVLDMLNYSKEREPDYSLCDLNSVIESICELMAEKASQNGVAVSWIAEQELTNVVIDAKGIKRCVLNLVSNGIDACGDVDGNNTVTVSMKMVGLTSFTIRIEDTGCGIPDSAKKNLFKMFYSTKGNKGTGLGLAVTRKIILEHGGNIDVESVRGTGTAFIITLPFRENLDFAKETSGAGV